MTDMGKRQRQVQIIKLHRNYLCHIKKNCTLQKKKKKITLSVEWLLSKSVDNFCESVAVIIFQDFISLK